MKDLYKHIGQKIRIARKSKEMTLEDLAFEINMDWSFLARIETGKAVASIETLYKICSALNIELSYLFDNKDLIKDEVVDKDLHKLIKNLPLKEKQKILKALKILIKG